MVETWPPPLRLPASDAMEAELLRTVVDALDAAGIPHMVTGSLASAIHGQPRATRDIDLVIDPEGEAIEILVASFATDRFYVGDALTAVAHRDMFNVIDTATGWKADLIIRKDRPFSREEFARRQPAMIAGVRTYVSTAEDAILSKLEWHRMSGSDTQRRDVIEMIIANLDTLDRRYLDRWAKGLGLGEVLDNVWDEALAER